MGREISGINRSSHYIILCPRVVDIWYQTWINDQVCATMWVIRARKIPLALYFERLKGAVLSLCGSFRNEYLIRKKLVKKVRTNFKLHSLLNQLLESMIWIKSWWILFIVDFFLAVWNILIHSSFSCITSGTKFSMESKVIWLILTGASNCQMANKTLFNYYDKLMFYQRVVSEREHWVDI